MAGLAAQLSRRIGGFAVFSVAFGTPLAAWLLREWLNGYHYQVPLSAAPFLICTGLLLIVVVVSVSVQTIAASLADPVETLRRE